MDTPKTRVLVADDDLHTLRVVTMWLQRHGYEVAEAHDGAEALRMCRARVPDLLVTDVNMPYLSGFELVRTIRADGLDVRGVVVLTNRCDQIEILEELEGLDVNLLAKPFSPSKLLELIRSLDGGVAADSAVQPAGGTP